MLELEGQIKIEEMCFIHMKPEISLSYNNFFSFWKEILLTWFRFKKYLRTHKPLKTTQNDVVYMPDQYVVL